MEDFTSGFGVLLDAISFENGTLKSLAATCDRFHEARFFERLSRDVPAVAHQLSIVNWYVSACVTSVISVRDGAKSDFATLGRHADFPTSILAKEFFLKSDDPDWQFRDPLAVNRAFRDLRNLRVHHAKALVLLRTPALLADIAENPDVSANGGTPRWFLTPLDVGDLGRLRQAHLLKGEVEGFNEWVDTRPLSTVLCQHLLVLADAIKRTGEAL